MTSTNEKIFVVNTKPLQSIDLVRLSEGEKEELSVLWGEYTEYVHRFCETMFSFEDFAAHTAGKTFPHKAPLKSEYIPK